MGGFREAKVDKIREHLFKLENGKTYVIKIVEDLLLQWQEAWPCFVSDDGSLFRRRFVADDDFKNFAPIQNFKKNNNIKEMLSSISSDRDRQMALNNWNPSQQFANIVIVGTEQMVTKNGKKKVKINWDFNAKIMQYGIKLFRALDAVNHSPTNIERAEDVAAKTGKFKMASDPDDSNDDGYLCTDVYAIRITKQRDGSVSYTAEASKVLDPEAIKAKVIKLDEVKEIMRKHSEPTPISQIEQFIVDNSDGMMGEEAESVEEQFGDDDVDQDSSTPKNSRKKGKAKSKKSSTKDDDEIEDIEVDSEDEEEDVDVEEISGDDLDDELEID